MTISSACCYAVNRKTIMAKPTQVQKAAAAMSKKRWAGVGKKARSQFMKRIRAGRGAQPVSSAQAGATEVRP